MSWFKGSMLLIAGVMVAAVVSVAVVGKVRGDGQEWTPPVQRLDTSREQAFSGSARAVRQRPGVATPTGPAGWSKFSDAERNAYKAAYRYCDGLMTAGSVNAGVDVIAYEAKRKSNLYKTTRVDLVRGAEWQGCADGDAQTPLRGSGITVPPFPS